MGKNILVSWHALPQGLLTSLIKSNDNVKFMTFGHDF